MSASTWGVFQPPPQAEKADKWTSPRASEHSGPCNRKQFLHTHCHVFAVRSTWLPLIQSGPKRLHLDCVFWYMGASTVHILRRSKLVHQNMDLSENDTEVWTKNRPTNALSKNTDRCSFTRLKFVQNIQTAPAANQAFYSVGTGVLFLRLNRQRYKANQ